MVVFTGRYVFVIMRKNKAERCVGRNMEKYTILLVDDEEEVIQAIIRKIKWEDLGFSVLGYADNGVKALEMIEEHQPDVVMTDIKMPYMDGMELCSHIRMEYPAMKIVLFTGFDEFEYAKEAVHLEVEEYILKPVNSVELVNIFTHLKAKLDQEISERRSMEKLEQYYTESLPLLQANFYSTLIEGRIHEEELQRYLSDYQISLPGPLFCCLVIHMSSSQVPENMNSLFLAASVQKQAEERLGKRWRAKCFPYLGNSVLFAQLNGENEIAELTDDCDRFCKYVNRIIGAVVTVGIGQVCSSALDLAQSYNTAREAVSYRAVYGASRAINIKEIAPSESGETRFTNDTELLNLFKKIRLNSRDEIIEAVEDCGFFESIPLWAVTLIGGLFITVLSFIMIMSVYGRFFRLYLYTAIAPIPLSSFAGEPSQNIGRSFLKSYAAVCLEGAIVVLACIIFSLFASSPPVVNPDAAAVTMVWSYIGELIFNMLVLVGAVKMSDRVVREMMGL